VVDAEVALVWDAPSWWALQSRVMPAPVSYLDGARAVHRALWRAATTADFARPGADLSRYRLVLVPHLYAVSDEAATTLADYVAGGGTLVVWYLSGTVDLDLRIRLGGYAGAFADLLGIRVQEFHPLPGGVTVQLSTGDTGSAWSEHLHVTSAQVHAGYIGGALDGLPAITHHAHGAGTAWYVSTALDDTGLDRLLAAVLARAGLPASGVLPEVEGGLPGVELVRRRNGETSWLFAINHTDETRDVPAKGVDLVTGADTGGCLRLAPGGYAVVREAR
jgi:beta-galactosidase